MKKVYTVEALWDEEAKVWVALGVDVPGLSTEAPTMEKLVRKLDVMVPEMLRANGMLRARKTIPFRVLGEVNSVAHVH
jgi:hypothetical protein